MADEQPKPGQIAETPPADISQGNAQTRIIIAALENRLAGLDSTMTILRSDVTEIRTSVHTDFRLLLFVFGGGFLILAGMLIAGYFRLEDKVSASTQAETRIDTRLEDLLLRIPPVATPVPRR